MKIRNGFVSNSSSSSFVVFGIRLNDSKEFLNKILGEPKTTKTPGCSHNIDREAVKFCPECGKETWIIKTERRYGIGDYEAEICKLTGLDAVTWGGESYLGKNLKYWEKEKTATQKLQKLNEVMLKLNEMFPNQEANFFEDASYDG